MLGSLECLLNDPVFNFKNDNFFNSIQYLKIAKNCDNDLDSLTGAVLHFQLQGCVFNSHINTYLNRQWPSLLGVNDRNILIFPC